MGGASFGLPLKLFSAAGLLAPSSCSFRKPERMEDTTGNCVFSVQRVLSYICAYVTLLPGDIVTTGTPRGVAPMQPGDMVEVEIDGIGRLRNPVQAQD
jgi:2-keto-4-pentenoate hydratase/2-oxohepta-3-ene-1,7-dioic acid hydratase in catechol pathway